jgi:hypothetical protein
MMTSNGSNGLRFSTSRILSAFTEFAFRKDVGAFAYYHNFAPHGRPSLAEVQLLLGFMVPPWPLWKTT